MIRMQNIRQTPYLLQFIFEGQVYNSFHRGTLEAGGGADTVNIQVKTNGNKITHLVGISLQTNSDHINLDFIEDPTLTDGTTPIDTFNYDRRWNTVGRPSDAEIYSDPTNISGGTVIDGDSAFGTSVAAGFKSASSAVQSFVERPLKPNTDYLIRIINFDSVDIDYTLKLNFYESGN